MNFNDISVGLVKKFQVHINEDLVNQFAELSGDFNPLHMNAHYSEKTKYGKRVVHGMLLASFLSRLVGMHLPGSQALYLQQSLKFKKPSFIDDFVTVIGEVVSVSEQLKIITLQTLIINQEEKILLEGESKVLFRED